MGVGVDVATPQTPPENLFEHDFRQLDLGSVGASRTSAWDAKAGKPRGCASCHRCCTEQHYHVQPVDDLALLG
jgi:hypothetical protein